MTRKFYEEPQILVMEMEEEEICSVSDTVGAGNTQSINFNNNVSSFHSGDVPVSNGQNDTKTFGFGGDDSEESIW